MIQSATELLRSYANIIREAEEDSAPGTGTAAAPVDREPAQPTELAPEQESEPEPEPEPEQDNDPVQALSNAIAERTEGDVQELYTEIALFLRNNGLEITPIDSLVNRRGQI